MGSFSVSRTLRWSWGVRLAPRETMWGTASCRADSSARRRVTRGAGRRSDELGEDRVRHEDAAVRESDPPVADRHHARRKVPGEVRPVRARGLGEVTFQPHRWDALRETEPEDDALGRDLALGQALPALDRPAAAEDRGPPA